MSKITLECDLRFNFSFVSSIYIINQGNHRNFVRELYGKNRNIAWGKDSKKVLIPTHTVFLQLWLPKGTLCTKMPHIRKLDQWLSLKVSKSQRHFSWTSITPQTNEIFDKILPDEARLGFCQIFHSFFGQWSFKKKMLWYLLTFRF